MDGLSEMMRQPEGMAMVLAFLALLVAVMTAFYGALERAALARRLAAIEADMDERMGQTPPPLSACSAGVAETADDKDQRGDSLPPGIRFV